MEPPRDAVTPPTVESPTITAATPALDPVAINGEPPATTASILLYLPNLPQSSEPLIVEMPGLFYFGI